MTRNDWYETGEQIKNLVQDAVDTGDFSQLGNTISNVVNDAMDGLQDALRGNLGSAGTRGGSYGNGYGSYGNTNDSRSGDCDQTCRGSADRTRRAYEQAYGRTAGQSSQNTGWSSQSAGQASQTAGRSSWTAGQTYDRRYQPPAVKRRVPGELGSKVMKYAGYGLGVMFGGALALEAMIAALTGNMIFLVGSGMMNGIC
ncbi:MAG: hypothetical protein LUG56_08860, partial [Lachnospiraceae bacterium]|nr:hypothetical protein [Lachnospiraceae bacterium]